MLDHEFSRTKHHLLFEFLKGRRIHIGKMGYPGEVVVVCNVSKFPCAFKKFKDSTAQFFKNELW